MKLPPQSGPFLLSQSVARARTPPDFLWEHLPDPALLHVWQQQGLLLKLPLEKPAQCVQTEGGRPTT